MLKPPEQVCPLSECKWLIFWQTGKGKKKSICPEFFLFKFWAFELHIMFFSFLFFSRLSFSKVNCIWLYEGLKHTAEAWMSVAPLFDLKYSSHCSLRELNRERHFQSINAVQFISEASSTGSKTYVHRQLAAQTQLQAQTAILTLPASSNSLKFYAEYPFIL